jgi:uncharacterized cupredoxin-like copper-binding protein
MRKFLFPVFAVIAVLLFGVVALAQETDDTADGATLNSVTADSASFFGQEVTLEGEVVEFLNARTFVLGEGAPLFDAKVLVINNTNRELDPSIISGERARLTGIVMPSFEEGGFGQLLANGIHMDGVTTTDGAATTDMTTDSTTDSSDTAVMPAMAVQVNLSDGVIEMPTSIQGGMTTFQVTNNGTMEHSFVIEGSDFQESLPFNLQPGETQTLEVDLAPGTYTVYCPVEDHAAQGMSIQIEVTAAEAGETDTMTDPNAQDPNAQPTADPNVDTNVEPVDPDAAPDIQTTVDPNVDPNTQPVDPNTLPDMDSGMLTDIDLSVLEAVIAERYPNYTILELTSMQDVEALLEPVE